jgi:hypothetical protein
MSPKYQNKNIANARKSNTVMKRIKAGDRLLSFLAGFLRMRELISQ